MLIITSCTPNFVLVKSTIPVIQFFRGFSALLVCFFHMKAILIENDPWPFVFANGSIGVPVFFMISGFIMYYSTVGEEQAGKGIGLFFLKRLIRIVPLYYICTLISILILNQTEYFFRFHPEKLLPTIFFYPTGESMKGASYGMPALAVGWSLNYEMYFYFLIGIGMFFRRYRWLFVFSIIIFSVFFLPLFTHGYVMKDLSGSYDFSFVYPKLMTNPVHLFFLIGVFLGWLYKMSFFRDFRYINFLIFLASLNFILSYFNVYKIFPSGYVSALFNCGILIMVCLWRDKIKTIQPPRMFVWIGNISYSIYLIHPLVITGLYHFMHTFKIPMQSKGWGYFFLVLLFVFIFSFISYQLIERLLSRFLLKFFLKRN